MKPIFWSVFVILTALNVHHFMGTPSGSSSAEESVMATTESAPSAAIKSHATKSVFHTHRVDLARATTLISSPF